MSSDDAETRQAVIPAIPEKWPEPVDGNDLLDALRALFERYLYLPDGASIALALWVVHTYAIDAADHFPIIFARSPEKGCGKTTLLLVLKGLVKQPLMAANLSVAALFRLVDQLRPTLLIDEADMFLRAKDELIGLLNSGHARGGNALRMERVGDRFDPRSFSTWGPKSIAAIGSLPEPLVDRSIVIYLHKRPADVKLERLTPASVEAFDTLRRQVVRWVADNISALRQAEPTMPPQIQNRSADNWRPLFAIADAVSIKWATESRHAAVVLFTEDTGFPSEQQMLLADIKAYFEAACATEVSTASLERWLFSLRERSWRNFYGYGRGIDGRGIAKLLGEYGIKPKKYRIGDGETIRGYRLDAKLQRVLETYVAHSTEPVEQVELSGSVPDVPSVPGVREQRPATVNLPDGKSNS